MKTTVGQEWAGLVAGFTGSRADVRGLVDYCRFFSAEDAMRWALAAHVEASRFVAQSEGPWVDGGVPWSTPEGFADLFKDGFERRLWDACERSARFREVSGWSDRVGREAVAGDGSEVDGEAGAEPELLRPQMPGLPQCGTVVAEVASGGGAEC